MFTQLNTEKSAPMVTQRDTEKSAPPGEVGAIGAERGGTSTRSDIEKNEECYIMSEK